MASTDTHTEDVKPRNGVLHRLYTGTGAFNIVGRRKVWYLGFCALFLVCLASIGIKGFNLGIDFEGGTQIQMPAVGAQGPIEPRAVEKAYADALGHPPVSAQTVGSGGSQSILIRSETLQPDQAGKVKSTIFDQLQPIGQGGQPSPSVISDSAVSGTWGGEITQQALIALAVFLVLVAVFLAFYFERWMAVAALIALGHDVLVTAGVYSLIGFEVTPATVIGLLTILGFSLYDTVVVFDKVRENTRGLLGLSRRTYAEAANLAVNQTLMRSINTTLIAILPVLGLLVIGAGMLGVGTLKDLAIVQLIGMIAGALSSICLATSLLVDFKMRDQRFKDQAARVASRRKARAKDGAASADEAGENIATTPDEQEIVTEQRSERAMAAASSVPGRTGKGADSRKSKNKGPAKPSGKAGRPSGKRRR